MLSEYPAGHDPIYLSRFGVKPYSKEVKR